MARFANLSDAPLATNFARSLIKLAQYFEIVAVQQQIQIRNAGFNIKLMQIKDRLYRAVFTSTISSDEHIEQQLGIFMAGFEVFFEFQEVIQDGDEVIHGEFFDQRKIFGDNE